MSQIQFVFLKKNNMPQRVELQAALKASGYSLLIDSEFEFLTEEGSVPATLNNGQFDCRFEIFYDQSEELLEELNLDIAESLTEETNADVLAEQQAQLKELRSLIGDKDLALSLYWGAEFLDCIAVLMVSICLAKHFGAVVSYAGVGEATVEAMESGLQECLNEIPAS